MSIVIRLFAWRKISCTVFTSSPFDFSTFSEFLADVSEDVFQNERTGYQDSAIWNKPYTFQGGGSVEAVPIYPADP
jgi:hypothetical protein